MCVFYYAAGKVWPEKIFNNESIIIRNFDAFQVKFTFRF